MRVRLSRLIVTLLYLGITASAVSCLNDETEEVRLEKKIGFRVESDSEFVTRSGEEVAWECDDRKMTLTFAESAYASAGKEESTRGLPFSDTENPLSEIVVSALLQNGDGGALYFRDEKVSLQDNEGLSSHFWPENNLSFFAYACSKSGVSIAPQYRRSEGVCSATFDYALPTPAASSPKKDASAQPDLLFAITPDQSAEEMPQVKLLFHHALSALVFKLGKVPEGVEVKSIAIGGVYGAGTCTVTPGSDEELTFSWDYTGKSQNLTFCEEVTTETAEGVCIGGEEAVFMMLPQTMSEVTTLRLTVEEDGTPRTLEKPFKEFIAAWEADKKYTFTIGFSNDIDVEVLDVVEKKLKKDLTIQNTGSVKGYIRAAIVGCWVNNAGGIVLPWNDSDGEFVWGDRWNTYWKKGTDGFFYHLNPVEGGEYTEYPLFESYTLKTSTEVGSTHAFYTLEFSIVAQIIPEKEKALWPEL